MKYSPGNGPGYRREWGEGESRDSKGSLMATRLLRHLLEVEVARSSKRASLGGWGGGYG